MVVVAGMLTDVCCDGGAREATIAGYNVTDVSNADAAVTNAERNAASLKLQLNFTNV